VSPQNSAVGGLERYKTEWAENSKRSLECDKEQLHLKKKIIRNFVDRNAAVKKHAERLNKRSQEAAPPK
jgi:hypothetical protein